MNRHWPRTIGRSAPTSRTGTAWGRRGPTTRTPATSTTRCGSARASSTSRGSRRFGVRGRDAAAVCDHVVTRDMSRIPVGRSAYGPILQDDGGICDDVIIFNVAEDDCLFVHGAGAGLERLQESAEGKQVSVAFDDDLHDISLQGPASVGFLDQHTPIDLPALGYFHQAETHALRPAGAHFADRLLRRARLRDLRHRRARGAALGDHPQRGRERRHRALLLHLPRQDQDRGRRCSSIPTT